MTIKSVTGFMAILLAASAMPASAEDFYVALDHGISKASGVCTAGGCNENASIFRISAGYLFSPRWALELSYGDYGKASSSASTNWEARGIQLSGTGSYPLYEGVSLLGKLGIAHTQFESYGMAGTPAADDTRIAYGIGGTFDYSPSANIRLQYESLGKVGNASTTGTARITLLSLGIALRF